MVERAEVVVAGAGPAGLAAARILQGAGLHVLVCEAGDDIGGRVRTDVIDGFRLDRGFQVLLPAYPAVRELSGLADLRLQYFTRGVIADGQALAPPWRHRRAVRDLLACTAGRPRDVAALLTMSARDVLAPARRLEAGADSSIAEDLARRGVGDRTVDEVLRPFLAGVFLDRPLRTSARAFHLVWRSFLRGGAALPASGMGALPHLLARDLVPGTVRCGVRVTGITGEGVTTDRGEVLARAVVVAAADGLLGVPEPEWHAVTTYYYRTSGHPPSRQPTLRTDSGDLLVNTAVISAVAPGYAPPGQTLVAASVPERCDTGNELEPHVRTTLARMYDTTTTDWERVETYAIARALPVMPAGHPLRQPVRLAPGRYVCGDHRDTSSIQGALVSGRRAATAVLADLRSRP
ncbi:oxidoreductase [Amycolatopsis sp. KNN50.9b]|nr:MULTISPECIES: FAD-dependent oxidoreductase [Amycolatopsis]OXM75202.1 oxidoreductase [Amycolatopsis sp. KNN50.9b]